MTAAATDHSLSHRQRRTLRTGGGTGYVVIVIAVDAQPDADRLHQAVLSVVQRHEMLRTTFEVRPALDEPVQVVHPEARVCWTTIGPVDDPDALARDMTGGPRAGLTTIPVEAVLVTGAGASARLVLTVPAPAVDVHSAEILLADLQRAYADPSLDADRPVVQFSQFADWQRLLLTDGDVTAGMDHWRRVFASAVPGTPLPLSYAADPAAPPVSVTTRRRLPDTLGAAIDTLAARLEESSATVVSAAWSVVLARLTCARRITVWRAVEGRGSTDLNGTVGPFAQYVPLTVALRPETTFADVLAQVGHHTREDRRWIDMLSADIIDAVGEGDTAFGFESVARSVARAGFSVADSTDTGALRGVTMRHLAGPRPEIDVRHREEHADAEILLDQILLVLDLVCADPDTVVATLPLVTARERDRMAAANQVGPAPARLMLAMIGDQIRSTPDEIAASHGADELTYAELDARADQLAAALREQGVRRGSVCAFWVTNGLAILPGLLGVLRAGAAFLPLDPQWPYERIATVLRDYPPTLLVTDSSLVPDVAAVPLLVLRLDDEVPPSPESPQTEPLLDPDCGPDDLAYVIYTSGSTGRPKGVCVTHRGLANYVAHCSSTYPVLRGRTWAVHSPIAYDMTMTTLFGPLVTGGRVRFTTTPGVDGLAASLARHGDLGLLKLTPTHLRLLLRVVDPQQLTEPMTAVIGGEALDEELLARWRVLAPSMTLFNEYGPTETVVGCAVHDCSVPVRGPAVPIGRPVSGTRLHVLDDVFEPVPMGMPGQLYVGGAGVARGYHGRPDLTAERFVPDPAGEIPGARLYATGDVVRYLRSGDLEYVGRIDDQWQVNGFRVEPGEIEAVLREHPDVVAAGCGVHRDGDGIAHLVACVVAGQRAPSPDELRGHLRDRLPQQMVPDAVAIVAALPQSASGKIDRAAVPAAVDAAARRPAAALPGRSELEQAIMQVWQEVLGNPWVEPDSNFFDLGGTSFLLLEVAIGLQTALGVEVTILALLEHPTVAATAEMLVAQAGPPAPPEVATGDDERARRRREVIDNTRRQRTGRSGS